MTRFLSHIPVCFAVAASDLSARADAWTPEAGLTTGKTANPNALALRHAP